MNTSAHRRARGRRPLAVAALAAAALGTGLSPAAHAAAPAARSSLPAFTSLNDPAGDAVALSPGADTASVDITQAAAVWVGGTIRLYAQVVKALTRPAGAAAPASPGRWTPPGTAPSRTGPSSPRERPAPSSATAVIR